MGVGRVEFSFCCLGALFGSSFSSAPHLFAYLCTVVGTNSLLFAWRTRFDVARKKKRQARQAAHRKKSNNRYHSCNPCPHYCTWGQILSCLPSAPASMLQERKKNDKHDRQRTAKNQTTVTTAVTPALTTVRRDRFSPCLAHPLRCCKKKKK